MLGNSRDGYEAYEQLAIYYEHEAREPRHALTMVVRRSTSSVARTKQGHRGDRISPDKGAVRASDITP